MSTSGNGSSTARKSDSPGQQEPPSPRPRLSRKALIAAAAILLILLVGGAIYAARRGSDAAPEASKQEKAGAKEGKSKHGSKDQKKEPKKEAKTAKAHAKPAHGEAKEAGKEGKHAKKESKKPAEDPPGKSPPPAEAVEAAEQPAYLGEGRALMGSFSVKIFDPLTRTMLRTDFKLEAVLACEDEAEFQGFLRSHLQFFREQVMVALRTSDAVDFADPSLQLVTRRMIARVNRAMGRPFVKSVQIKDFTVYESVDNSPYVRWQPAAAESP